MVDTLMHHFLPVLLFLLGACSTAPIGQTHYISFAELRKGLEHQTGVRPHLEDTGYSTVSLEEVHRASLASWISSHGGYDCDDDGSQLCAKIVRERRMMLANFAPAIGTMEGHVDGGPLHCIVWHLKHNGEFGFYDPSRQRPLRRAQLTNLAFVSDK
jgi:hypothetical protein